MHFGAKRTTPLLNSAPDFKLPKILLLFAKMKKTCVNICHFSHLELATRTNGFRQQCIKHRCWSQPTQYYSNCNQGIQGSILSARCALLGVGSNSIRWIWPARRTLPRKSPVLPCPSCYPSYHFALDTGFVRTIFITSLSLFMIFSFYWSTFLVWISITDGGSRTGTVQLRWKCSKQHILR